MPPAGAHSLNPFENQVYFYHHMQHIQCTHLLRSLNPFENQVYFYANTWTTLIQFTIFRRLNPFENQVYFYACKAEERKETYA